MNCIYTQPTPIHLQLLSLFAIMLKYSKAVIHLNAKIHLDPYEYKHCGRLAHLAGCRRQTKSTRRHWRSIRRKQIAPLDPISRINIFGRLAHLARAPHWRCGGDRFESYIAHQDKIRPFGRILSWWIIQFKNRILHRKRFGAANETKKCLDFREWAEKVDDRYPMFPVIA